uniref:Uncharacterized protein n=1 Tax=Panagrolaimus sp. JU765 TaxID=591449 RepID=A0AC34R7W2_9BILA
MCVYHFHQIHSTAFVCWSLLLRPKRFQSDSAFKFFGIEFEVSCENGSAGHVFADKKSGKRFRGLKPELTVQMMRKKEALTVDDLKNS